MEFLDVLSNLIHNTIVFATALVFAAIGGLYSERSGVVNIALEGMMIMGAFTSAVFTYFVDQALGGSAISPWIGLLAAFIFGALFALPHAIASISLRADQVVSGVALNFLALGLAVYITKILFNGAGQTETLKTSFSKIHIPFLSDIPYIGKALFVAYPTSYLAFIVVAITWYVIFKTPFGLRLRAVGEHPRAADTVGINVYKMRYIAVLISGALAGLGGATIALTTTNNFSHNTVSGQGFIALAALIFGKWNPVGVMFAALFFGIASAIKSVLQVYGITDYLPVDYIYIFPYVLTILVLAGFVGKAEGPKELGNPYTKGSR